MNTFLPYPDFDASAECLDRQRLGKQRVEVLQLLRGSWFHHPASRMWSQHLGSLAEYGTVICWEWRMRGYRDNVLDQIEELAKGLPRDPPPWLGDDRVHSAMRASLLAKDYRYYRQFGWAESPAYGYRWDLCTSHLGSPILQPMLQVVQCAWEIQASAQGSYSARCSLPVVIGDTLCAEHRAMLERSKQS